MIVLFWQFGTRHVFAVRNQYLVSALKLVISLVNSRSQSYLMVAKEMKLKEAEVHLHQTYTELEGMMLALMVYMYGVPKLHIFNIPSISIEIPSITIDIPGISNQNLVHRIKILSLSPTGAIYLVERLLYLVSKQSFSYTFNPWFH